MEVLVSEHVFYCALWWLVSVNQLPLQRDYSPTEASDNFEESPLLFLFFLWLQIFANFATFHIDRSRCHNLNILGKKVPKCPPPIQVSNSHGLFGFFVICSILQPHKAAKGLRLIYFCALVVTMEDRPHFHLKQSLFISIHRHCDEFISSFSFLSEILVNFYSLFNFEEKTDGEGTNYVAY